MPESLWKQMEAREGMPYYLEPSDICYYARDYISGGGYRASIGNDLVSNFKKPLSAKGTWQWRHKLAAVQQFGAELSQLFHPDYNYAVAAIPPSRAIGDPDYDPRLDEALLELVRRCPRVVTFRPFEFDKSHAPQHQSTSRMNPGEVYSLLKWTGFGVHSPQIVVLVDDVITCGAHFKACKRLVLEHHPKAEVVGVFWGKTIWPKPASGE